LQVVQAESTPKREKRKYAQHMIGRAQPVESARSEVFVEQGTR